MKSLNKYKQIIITLVVIVSANTYVSAQTDSSYYFSPFFELYNTWINSDNVAGYQYFEDADFTEVKATLSSYSGDFSSSYSPRNSNAYSVDILGHRKINGISYYGLISFESQKKESVKWSYLMNSNTGTPYIIGDSIAGDFNNERFKLFGGVSGNLFTDRVKFGLSVDYYTSIGAKNKDPRSLNRYIDIALCPSFVFQISKSFRVGLASGYSFKREAIKIGSFSDSKENIFYFKGLGFMSSFTSLEQVNRKYFTEVRSISLQSQYIVDDFMSHLDVKFSYLEDVVEDGHNVIKPEFYYENQNIDITSLSKIVTGDYVSKVKLKLNYVEGVGEVSVLKSMIDGGSYNWSEVGVNKDYTNDNLNVELEYLLKKSFNYIGLDCTYNKSNEEYYFSPSTFYQRYSNLIFGVQMSGGIEINKSRLSLSSRISTRINSSKENYLLDDENSLEFNIPKSSDFIISDLANNEFLYNTTNYIKYNFSLKYDVLVELVKQSRNMYVVLDYTGLNAESSLENHYISLSLGLKL